MVKLGPSAKVMVYGINYNGSIVLEKGKCYL